MIPTGNNHLDAQVRAALARLSPAEKLDLLSGDPHWFTKAHPRAGIPALQTANGPLGVRPFLKAPVWEGGTFAGTKATAFPGGVALAAAWDPELSERVGAAMADECVFFGVDVLLAPCVCLVRVPYGGRNFESHGEDPFLAGRLAGAFIRGVEGRGIAASLKHYACNDTDWKRHHVDMRVAEKPLRELYLRAFQIAIEESDPETVMFAYPKVNGRYCSEHPDLLHRVLREEWGYGGIAISDWSAVRSALPSFLAGSDLEMARARFFTPEQLPEVAAGTAHQDLLDEKVARVVRLALKRAAFVEATPSGRFRRPGSAAQRKLARLAARESMVLLKNEGNVLPLDPGGLRRIAVIGPNADVLRLGGGGSSVVCAERTRAPLAALRERLGEAAEILHAPGIRHDCDVLPIPDAHWFRDEACTRPGVEAAFFNNLEWRGAPTVRRRYPRIEADWGDFSPERAIYPSYFSARFEGWLRVAESGPREFRLLVKDGARLWLDGELVLDLVSGEPEGAAPGLRWSRAKRADAVVELVAERPVRVRIDSVNRLGKACLALGWQPHDADPVAAAVEAARRSDRALVFVGSGDEEREGGDLDRPTLPEGQDELIARVREANPNTVVVLHNGTPYQLGDWVGRVPAVLQGWFPGQEGGEAVADLLLGEASPGGKLPFTYFRRLEDNPATATYPAVRHRFRRVRRNFSQKVTKGIGWDGG